MALASHNSHELAVYPAMMHDTSSLSWAIGATAHEWAHHYYFFRLKPVGLYYEAKPDVRTINETTANIAGDAIKERVRAFIDALAPITSREMLLALLDARGIEYPPSTSDQN